MSVVAPALDSELEGVAAFVNEVYRGPNAKTGWATEADYIVGQRTNPPCCARGWPSLRRRS